MSLDRRAFLARAGTLGALAALGVTAPRLAGAADPAWQGAGPGMKVLEINLAGGWSCFECVLGRNNWSGAFSSVSGFYAGAQAAGFTWPHTVGNAGGSYRMNDGADPFFSGFSGWKTNMVLMGHDLLPHEAAVPLTHTGTSLGRANHAGTAAIINHAYGQGAPLGFVIYGKAVGDAMTASSTQGIGGHAYPVLAEITEHGLTNAAMFQRGSEAPRDPMLARFRSRYQSRLVHAADGQVRSKGFGSYEGATRGASSYSSYIGSLTLPSSGNATENRIAAAASLLAGGARYVCVVEPDFDTHHLPVANGDSAMFHNLRLYDILTELSWVSTQLSNTVIVITTEFGRNAEGSGTGHFPKLYAQFAMHPSSSPGFAVVGSPSSPMAPSEFRAAVLHAAGIDAMQALTADPATTGNVTLSPAVVNSLYNTVFA